MVHAVRITRHSTDIYLDAPKSGVFRSLGAIAFSGWAVPSVNEVQIEFPTHRVAVSKTLMRPDVTAHLGRTGIETFNDCHSFAVLTETQPFQVYALFQDGTRKLQLAGEVESPNNVMLGANGWLFLSSSNGILEQAARTFNPAPRIRVWDEYLDKFDALAKEMNIQWQFCIAPSKELIVPELAPFPVSDNHFLATFLKNSRFRDFFSCPIDQFKKYSNISYWPADSHWSDVGAAIAVKDILRRFGRHNFIQPNIGVEFSIGVGNLSDKLLGQHESAFPGIPVKNENVELVYDNYASIGGNTGRFMIWDSSDVEAEGTLFVSFGSSFGWMSTFLVSSFKRTVFLHATGRIDAELLAEVSPTHVLLQNNSRFMPDHFDQGHFSKLENIINPLLINEEKKAGYAYYDRVAASCRNLQ